MNTSSREQLPKDREGSDVEGRLAVEGEVAEDVLTDGSAHFACERDEQSLLGG